MILVEVLPLEEADTLGEDVNESRVHPCQRVHCDSASTPMGL